ncbi:Bacteroides conjugative transposon TraK protein [Arachidicoccus rhizosphaerae]|uniref:Bacteroides conjugative transposon TraK protein n=1 Tax=Arachidicoccus rhizosphaerae TaxID=551991 RepID=A0A1H4AAQ8_9BACT|nr:conjugative transposon protein TraK [Arachidicoccus rhizosphaerae]SEA33203.1 Bacteroides conjugative transposon TraK protein [Arachidicoccus rhizosphaerae]
MFEQLKNIDKAFQHVKKLSIVVTLASLATCCFAIAKSYQMVTRAESRIYLIAGGKALEAFSAGRKENIPVEAKDHIKMFHYYFFSLDPDEKVIEAHLTSALYLADGSARSKYEDLKEKRFYAGIISANISQQLKMDSIVFNMDVYPYRFRYYGTEKIIRPTVIVTRSLITEGEMRSVARSDHNPHGFLIERWRVLENRDLKTSARSSRDIMTAEQGVSTASAE